MSLKETCRSFYDIKLIDQNGKMVLLFLVKINNLLECIVKN